MDGKVPSKPKIRPLSQRSKLSCKYNKLEQNDEPCKPLHSDLRSLISDGVVEQENSTVGKVVDLPVVNEVKTISPNLKNSTFVHICEKVAIPKVKEHAESQIAIMNTTLANKPNLKCDILNSDISFSSTVQKHFNPTSNIDDSVANVFRTPKKLYFKMGPIVNDKLNKNEASLPQNTNESTRISGSHINFNNDDGGSICQKESVKDNLIVILGQSNEVSNIHGGEEVDCELSDVNQETFLCPLCWKQFNKNQSQISHMKSCATKHNITTQQLFNAIELLEKQNAERKALGLPRISQGTATIKKTRKVPSYKDLADPNIQLALALSESIRDAEELKNLQEDDILMEAGLGEEMVEKQKSLLERFGFTSSRPPIFNPDNTLRHRAGKKTSTLLLRTHEERERLITEKVAIILMDEEGIQSEPIPTREFQETPYLICHSDTLNNYQNKENHLWTMACKEDQTCENYYVKNLEGIEVKHTSQIPCVNPTIGMQDIQTQQELFTPLEAGTGLGTDWRKMLNNITMSDITICVKNELQIPAHKLVLFVRCPMILDDLVQEEDESSGKMLEKLIWNNMSYESVLAFLEYLYCGCVNNISNLSKSFSDLEWFSRRYSVEGLGKFLSEAIQTSYSNIDTDMTVDCNSVSPSASVSGTCSRILKPSIHSSKDILNEELEHSTFKQECHSDISFDTDSIVRDDCVSPDLFGNCNESMNDCKDVLSDNDSVHEENIEDVLSIANESSNDLQVSCTTPSSPIKPLPSYYSPDSCSQSKLMDTVTKRKYASTMSFSETGLQKSKKLCLMNVANDEHNSRISIDCEVGPDDCLNKQNELDSRNVCMKTANNNLKHTRELGSQTPGSRLNEHGTSQNKVDSEKCHNDSTNSSLTKSEGEDDNCPANDLIDESVHNVFHEGYVRNVWDDFDSQEDMPYVPLESAAFNLPTADCTSPQTLPREDTEITSHSSSELGVNKLMTPKHAVGVGKKSPVSFTSLSQNSYFHPNQEYKIICSTPNSNSLPIDDTLPGQFLDDPITFYDRSLTKSTIQFNKSKSHNDLNLLEDSFNEQMDDSNLWKGINVVSGSKPSESLKPKSVPKCTSTPPVSEFKISETEVTPMANYSGMETPHLKKELQKYGVKPLKRKQAKQILKHIYNELHPLVPLQQEGNGIQIQSQQNENFSNNAKDIMPQTSGTMNDFPSSSSSQNSSKEDCGPDEEMLGEPEMCSQKSSRKDIEGLPVVIESLITNNPILHKKVLLYEPILLEKLHADVKAQIKCKVDDVMLYLDQQCITYRTENGNEHHKKHKKVKKKSEIK